MGTLFGTIHSDTDLHLIQQSIEIAPASPKTKYADVPGANGRKDLTEALGVGVVYNDRDLSWTFALYPGDDWPTKRAAVSNALNGLACHITPDDESGWYYDGRLIVSAHKSDRLLHQITVKASCRPYKRKTTESTVTRSDLSTSLKSLNCNIGAMPLIPEITVAQATTIAWGSVTTTVQAGTHKLADLRMSGAQTIKAKVASGTGSITIKWREGSL